MKNDIVIIYSYPVFTKKIFTCSIEKLVAIFLFLCVFVCLFVFLYSNGFLEYQLLHMKYCWLLFTKSWWWLVKLCFSHWPLLNTLLQTRHFIFFRSSLLDVFFKIDVLDACNFINQFVPNAPYGFLMFQGVEKGCIGNEWVKKEILAQVFSCEFSKIFKNTTPLGDYFCFFLSRCRFSFNFAALISLFWLVFYLC